MSESIDSMLARLKQEHPELFSNDPLKAGVGFVAISFTGGDDAAPRKENSFGDALKFVGLYTIVDDYIFLEVPREVLIAFRHELKHDIVNRIDQEDLILSIKTVADAVESSAKLDHLAHEYQKNLAEPSRLRLERILKQDDRVFLCRQQVLSAFRESILHGTRVESSQIHPLTAAILLSPLQSLDLRRKALERATRIELAFSAWEADVLPLNYARIYVNHRTSTPSRACPGLRLHVRQPHFLTCSLPLANGGGQLQRRPVGGPTRRKFRPAELCDALGNTGNSDSDAGTPLLLD